MDNVRHLSGTINFAPFSFESVIVLPQDSRPLLLDVRCMIHGRPGYIGVSGHFGIGTNDVRVYINDIEITPAVVTCLRRAIDKADQTKVKSQYKAALERWFVVEDKLGAAYPGDPSQDRMIANQLLSTVPMSANLDRLGNNMAGASGNLHIFNFLYTQIEIDPILLTDILSAHTAMGNPAIDFSNISVPKIIVSSGPCRLFSDQWDPIAQPPRGTMEYRLDLVYHNPNDDEIAAIKDQLNRLEQKISTELRKILENVGINGIIQKQYLYPMQQQISVVSSRLNQSQADIQSAETQIDALKREVDDLKHGLGLP